MERLGETEDGQPVENRGNFPAGDVEEPNGQRIIEIPNAFPFRGATFIAENWAAEKAADPTRITLPDPPEVSMTRTIETWFEGSSKAPRTSADLFDSLPEPIQIAIATSSTDPRDLIRLAEVSCDFVYGTESRLPVGLAHRRNSDGISHPIIHHHPLFEVVANNPHLPGPYKQAMVLKPGVQGDSEIVGEWIRAAEESHVFEYLRRNSYIPWGHYAANMAHDAERYSIGSLNIGDMRGMRHLYYQRTYIRLARMLGIPIPARRESLDTEELEGLHREIRDVLARNDTVQIQFNSTLWGWNYGFDYAPSKYRLNASHQQIHQQYALIPARIPLAGSADDPGSELSAFACGDMVAEFIDAYRRETGRSFFQCYLKAIRGNRRVDGDVNADDSLIIFENDHVMVFVPKAQTSQWEIQVMPLAPVGNIIEADTATRNALDGAFLVALGILEKMGVRMVTAIEYSKRFDKPGKDQHLLYSFLPKIPISPGGFSEAQQRWIIGHYPEDFARACRWRLADTSQ